VQTGTTVTAVRSSGDTFLVVTDRGTWQCRCLVLASGACNLPHLPDFAVGEHVRMPRTYRGRDIQHWMEVIGRLDERYDEVEEILKARAVASPQLIGTPERRTLDLNALTDKGVRLRGRLGAIRDGVALFSGGLRNHCRLADQKTNRLLRDIDEWITAHDLDGQYEPPGRCEPTRIPKDVPLTLDLV